MRHLLYDYTDVRKPEYLTSAAAVQGIVIREYSDMFEIELPCLFPHRKQRQSSEYLTDPLYFLLSQYTDSHPVNKYTDCVVCFVHEYNKDLPNRRIRDYDNLEQKQMLDVIAAFILQDDGGMCCDSYNTVALGDADKTRIFIMPRNRFCTWIKYYDGYDFSFRFSLTIQLFAISGRKADGRIIPLSALPII